MRGREGPLLLTYKLYMICEFFLFFPMLLSKGYKRSNRTQRCMIRNLCWLASENSPFIYPRTVKYSIAQSSRRLDDDILPLLLVLQQKRKTRPLGEILQIFHHNRVRSGCVVACSPPVYAAAEHCGSFSALGTYHTRRPHSRPKSSPLGFSALKGGSLDDVLVAKRVVVVIVVLGLRVC